MCGIVGYIGPREAAPILLEGLARLEYRGYDSAGIALVTADGDLFVEKRAGKLGNLRTALARCHALGGHRPRPHPLGDPRPPERPQCASARRLHGRHHGHPQRHHRELPGAARRAGGARPRAALRDRHGGPRAPRRGGLRRRPRRRRSRTRCARPQGAYAVAVMHRAEPGRLVGARQDVPLVVGLGDGETFLASDVAAVLAHTDRVVFLEEGDVADLHADGVRRDRRRWSAPRARRSTSSTGRSRPPRRAATTHFMLKEMHEQPVAVRSAIAGRIHEASIRVPELDGLVDRDRGAPTASSSSPAAAPPTPRSSVPSAIQAWAGLPARWDVGSEFRYSPPPLDARTLVIAVTQSGETADTIAPDALAHASRAAPSSRSPIPWARPSRASATRSSSCRPGPRSRSQPPRPS